MKTHPLWAMRGTRSLLNQPLHPTVQREPRPNRNRVSKDGMILHRHLPLLSWKSFLNHPRTTPLDPTIPSNLTKGSHQVANPKETVMMEIRETTGSLEVEANMVILVGNHQMDQTCLEGRQTGYRIDMETLETQMILEARVAPEILEDQEDQMETVDPDTQDILDSLAALEAPADQETLVVLAVQVDQEDQTEEADTGCSHPDHLTFPNPSWVD